MSRHFPQVGGLWFSPLMVGHLCSCTAMVMVCAGLAPPAPTLLSTLLVVCATPIGLCAALNLFLGGSHSPPAHSVATGWKQSYGTGHSKDNVGPSET